MGERATECRSRRSGAGAEHAPLAHLELQAGASDLAVLPLAVTRGGAVRQNSHGPEASDSDSHP
eukprot:8297981-Alexandrium_andersonii.AAC.1